MSSGHVSSLQPGPLLSTVYQFTERLRAHSIRPVHVDLKALLDSACGPANYYLRWEFGTEHLVRCLVFTKEYDHARDFQIVEILEDAFRTDVAS
ncbi:uncharacterized protein EHS24_006905 [Apiotrichum porosum]|uniref:Uncharacterized protein n=1 Tax=Apiotrichum porosum TaxID=105984 RepID=A0A427XWH9_9TREE|nr:uncharacterized protein EHS24_006905 [Apiotrichum porosum]RSH83238.1 hypothetical protein EHS24_006905 [Apiotrichum porosum]